MLLPVYDRNPLRIIPFQFMTMSLVAVTTLIFLWETGQSEAMLQRSLSWLLKQAQVKECTCQLVQGPHKIARFLDSAFNISQMHGHGYATWALAMAVLSKTPSQPSSIATATSLAVPTPASTITG